MFFGSRCVCGFSGGSFPVCGSGGLLMSGTNMSIVWGEVVKGSATSTTSKRTFGSFLVLGFQVRCSFFLNCLSQRVHSYGFSPVWIR